MSGKFYSVFRPKPSATNANHSLGKQDIVYKLIVTAQSFTDTKGVGGRDSLSKSKNVGNHFPWPSSFLPRNSSHFALRETIKSLFLLLIILKTYLIITNLSNDHSWPVLFHSYPNHTHTHPLYMAENPRHHLFHEWGAQCVRSTLEWQEPEFTC